MYFAIDNSGRVRRSRRVIRVKNFECVFHVS